MPGLIRSEHVHYYLCTPERDAYEEELKLYAIGAAIRQTRKQQNLTQEEFGRMVGVQKACLVLY